MIFIKTLWFRLSGLGYENETFYSLTPVHISSLFPRNMEEMLAFTTAFMAEKNEQLKKNSTDGLINVSHKTNVHKRNEEIVFMDLTSSSFQSNTKENLSAISNSDLGSDSSGLQQSNSQNLQSVTFLESCWSDCNDVTVTSTSTIAPVNTPPASSFVSGTNIAPTATIPNVMESVSNGAVAKVARVSAAPNNSAQKSKRESKDLERCEVVSFPELPGYSFHFVSIHFIYTERLNNFYELLR